MGKRAKRVILLTGLLLIASVLVYFFGLKSDFSIDIEHSMYEKPPIDIRVSIDGKGIEPELFNRFAYSTDQSDVFRYNSLFGWSGGVEMKLSKGFHTILIESRELNIRKEEKIFIWKWSENSLIQYIDEKLIFEILDKPRVYE